MRLIRDPAVGASSCTGLSKLKDALMFISNCQKDPSLFMSDQWSSTIKSLQVEVMSLRTLFRYTEIGHEGYHEFQSLVTSALFFICRALDDNHLYREANWNSEYLLGDSIEDLRLAIEKIYHYTTSKEVRTYIVCLSVDLMAESISYLLRLVRMNCSGLRLEDEVAFWRQIAFLEFICSHTFNQHIMSELTTQEPLLVDTQAAIDTVINILSEFDPLCSWLYSGNDLIDPPANIGISSDLKLQKVGKNVEFISIALYVVIEKGSRSSSIDEVGVQFWESFIDSILHLLHQETILIIPWKAKMEILHDELSFLKYVLLDPPEELTGTENTSKFIGKTKHEICKKVALLIYSFYDTKFRNKAVGEIRETIDHFRSLLKESCRVPYFVVWEYRKNYGSESIDSFWKHLFILTHSQSVSIPLCQTKKVLEELTYCKDSLDKIAELEMIQDYLWVEIKDLAIVLEYVIKPPAVRSWPVCYKILWFLDIIDRIKLIKKTLSGFIYISDYWSADYKEERLNIALRNKWLVTLKRKGSIFAEVTRKPSTYSLMHRDHSC